ncbi:hypothetical protein P4E94_16625, partial [Pontiellaceae bacterium B12219]|nr:hypothetical protein [Pontiellaceae bacterium B12219]
MKKTLIIATLAGFVTASHAEITASNSNGTSEYDAGGDAVLTGKSSKGGYSQSLAGYRGQTITTTGAFDFRAIRILYESASAVSGMAVHIYPVEDPHASSYEFPPVSTLFSGTFDAPGSSGVDTLILSLGDDIHLDANTSYMILFDETNASSTNFKWRRSSNAGDFYADGQRVDSDGTGNATRDFLVGLVGTVSYSLVIEPPNEYRIPKIMGASGDQALLTGYDYFDWFGITEHRTWFKPSFSSLPDDSGITSAAAFTAASEAIRQDPLRQATSSDSYIDWAHFYSEYNNDQMPERMKHLEDRDIMPMIVNTTFISPDSSITDDWVNIFSYWKYWYTMVYYFASQHDVTMYEFRNEPHHNSADYDAWESHWLVCADAMRKAMEDVNEDFGKTLKLNICGPVCAGAYWDYSYPDPYVDPHGWGSVSWKKIKYDIYGNYDVNNPLNYGSYDYHRYGQDAADSESILLNTRSGIANANNDPSSDIPLVITEYNTSTGGNFDRREIDTEDLFFGVSMAQILEASAVYGPAGLGDEGGIFIFKLGAKHPGTTLVGVGNKLSYTSQNTPNNYGGVTRGGACFQMYARHFSGGKPLLPVVATSGASDERRTMAVIDEEKGMIYIYGSNVAGSDVPVSVDLSALDVEAGTVASLQRVDEKNTGQVTELLTLNSSKKLSFDCPNYTAFLIKVPMAETVPYQWELAPVEDTTQAVVDSGNQGALPTMKVSNHHSDATQRNAGLLRFSVEGAGNMGQALLKLSGRNTGTDPSEREILHVYAVTGEDWSEDTTLDWSNAPGLGQ